LKVISIKEKKIPEINDEFAKHLGEYEDLRSLKDKIRNELTASKEDSLKKEMAEEIIKKISDALSIELPETFVEQESRTLLKSLLSSTPHQDLKKEQSEALKAEAKNQAEENLKKHLILKKIAENEGWEITEEEMDEALKAIAKANNIPLEKLREDMNKEGRRETLRNNLLFKKTVDFLVKNAIIE
jgi:trigger factor